VAAVVARPPLPPLLLVVLLLLLLLCRRGRRRRVQERDVGVAAASARECGRLPARCCTRFACSLLPPSAAAAPPPPPRGSLRPPSRAPVLSQAQIPCLCRLQAVGAADGCAASSPACAHAAWSRAVAAAADLRRLCGAAAGAHPLQPHRNTRRRVFRWGRR
jgi:hypothetical protein